MSTFTEARAVPKRARDKARTRARLLAAARRLFDERGFDGTTLRDVARAAGVAVGTVFVHFRDKPALLSFALDDQLGAVLDRPPGRRAGAPARRAIRALVEALWRSYARNPRLARVLVQESLFLEGEGRPPAERRLAQFGATLLALLREPGTLASGVRAEDAAGAVAAAYFFGLVDGLRGETFDVARELRRFDRITAPWFARPEGSRR